METQITPKGRNELWEDIYRKKKNVIGFDTGFLIRI